VAWYIAGSSAIFTMASFFTRFGIR
jgi:hypothetical protein